MEEAYLKKKESIIKNFENGIENNEALAYAFENDCYPFYDDEKEFSEFENFFKIKKEELEEFYTYIDNLITNKDYKTYYEIENKFGGRRNRPKIIIMLTYAVLNGLFLEEDFKNTLLEFGTTSREINDIYKNINYK